MTRKSHIKKYAIYSTGFKIKSLFFFSFVLASSKYISDQKSKPPPTYQHLKQLEELVLRSQEQENYPCPQLAATLGRTGPAPHLSNTIEPTLLVVWMSLKVVSMRELSPLLLGHVAVWVEERCLPLIPQPLLPVTEERAGPPRYKLQHSGNTGPAPHLGSTIELAWWSEVRVIQPGYCEQGRAVFITHLTCVVWLEDSTIELALMI